MRRPVPALTIPAAPALLASALLASVLFPTSAAGGADDARREMFTPSQKIGYLGRTSRSALARNVMSRLRSRTEARPALGAADRVRLWHEIALDTGAVDHTPDENAEAAGFENGGPTRTSRALAMTQIAVFDAVNAFQRRYAPYNEIRPAAAGASLGAAIAQASHDVQAAIYPAQRRRLRNLLASDLSHLPADRESVAAGRKVGRAAAAAILERRAGDGSDVAEPDWGGGGRVADGRRGFDGSRVNGRSRERFRWEPDPLTPPTSGDFKLALGAFWGGVTPFSLASGDQFRCPPPPEPGSPKYVRGWWRTRLYGASPDTFPGLSTPRTRFIGNFWGYDATPLLGTPPRLYNQIAVTVAANEGLNRPADLARYLALVNVGLADAGIAAWDSKYYYDYWRPVTAIRRGDGGRRAGAPDHGAGPEPVTALMRSVRRWTGMIGRWGRVGRKIGLSLTLEDPDWKPVGISVINTEDPITPTPPFPAYPSGHSTFGAAAFGVMREHFGNDVRFTFVSEEYNGEGVDPLGVPRPLVPVRFRSLSHAQKQNGLSRIYNGSHWPWDDDAGQDLGEDVARHLLRDEPAFRPVESRSASTKNRRAGGRGK